MSTGNSVASRMSWPAGGLAALFDFAASSHRRAVCALLLAALVTFLPGVFQIPPLDRDEPRFAQATKQMIETGDYVDIRFQDEVRYKKPVGIYWLQAAAVRTAEALGVPRARARIWPYRLPSLIGAVGAVLATYWCALALVNRRGAMLAALMMMGSVLLGVEARLATTDAVLLLAVILAMGALARVYLAPAAARPGAHWRLPAVFWTALAAGVLLKGPVILMIVALAAATLAIVDRSARWLLGLRPLFGVLWLVVLVAPWFVAIYARVGALFFTDSVGHDMLAKIAGGQESHGAPPGLYLVLFFATFFPASVLAAAAAPAAWSMRREPATRFLLAWLVPSWIVFELIATKLPHYVLPLYPPIAILIAAAVQGKALSSGRWLKHATTWWFLVPVVASIAAVAAAIALEHQLVLPAWPFFAAAMVGGLSAWRSCGEGAEPALIRAIAAAVLMAIGLYALVVPALDPLFPSRTLARLLRQSGCTNPVAASVGYEEPSLVFLAGTATRFTDAPAAADFLKHGGCRFAFVEGSEVGAFARRAQAIALRYDNGPAVTAFNVSNGRRIAIAVFRSVEGAP